MENLIYIVVAIGTCLLGGCYIFKYVAVAIVTCLLAVAIFLSMVPLLYF
jgi:hypothetical protein